MAIYIVATVSIIIFSLQLASCQNAACINANTALASNSECLMAFGAITDGGNSENTAIALCEAPCRNLVNDILNNCPNTEIARRQIEQLCFNFNGPTESLNDDPDAPSATNTTDSPQCTLATVALASNTDCTNAVSDANNIDGATACSGACRPLFQAVINACGDSSLVTQQNINQTCGGAGAVKGLGIFGILLVATMAAMSF